MPFLLIIQVEAYHFHSIVNDLWDGHHVSHVSKCGYGCWHCFKGTVSVLLAING